jgi:hypothetical protein
MGRQLRVWLEYVETIVLEILLGMRKGRCAGLIRHCLWLLFRFFHLVVKFRRVLYRIPILRDPAAPRD